MTLPIGQPVASRPVAVGVDLGGTRLRVAAAAADGRVLAERDEPTGAGDAGALARQIAGTARAAVAEAGGTWDEVQQVAVGVPGVPAGDHLLRAPNLIGAGEELLGLVRAALDVPTRFDNDVNLAVLAERAHGHAEGVDDVAFVSLGTGIGMGALVGGRLVRGARGGAGEIGDLPYGRDPRDAVAREVGAMEEAAGGAGLARRYAAAVPAGDLEEGPAEHEVDARAIYALAAEGDAFAVGLVEEHAVAVATAIAAVVAVLDCELVVLGGSIGAREDVRARVGRALAELVAEPPALRSSSLGARAGLLGAVEAARAALDQPIAAGART